MEFEAMPDENALELANTLYWESNRSVNQIAEELDLSKGALYGAIRSLPAGTLCPNCHEELEFPNRTARDKGFVTCTSCGLEGHADDLDSIEPVSEGDADLNDTADALPSSASIDAPIPPESRAHVQPAGGSQVIAAAALLGAAAGFALALWTRKR